MFKSLCIKLLFLITLLNFSSMNIFAKYPVTRANPKIDGQFTNSREWASARTEVRTFPTGSEGTWYYQSKNNWEATSSEGNTATIKGLTIFALHDIWSSTTEEEADYNTLQISFWNRRVTVWIFVGEDETDDSWLKNTKIPENPRYRNGIDDRGFLVRLNNDPSTDRHWLPGDPEPGDSDWNGANYHYVFARATFNDTGRTVQGDTTYNPEGDNEVYELALMNRSRNEAINVNIYDPGEGNPLFPQTLRVDRTDRTPFDPLIILIAIGLLAFAFILSFVSLYDILLRRRWHPADAIPVCWIFFLFCALCAYPPALLWRMYWYAPYYFGILGGLWLLSALFLALPAMRRRTTEV